MNTSSPASQQGTISVPEGELYFQQWGSLAKKPPIIVLHGGPGLDQSYLLPQMLELAKDHEVIFYDQRGCGKSTTRALTCKELNVSRFVEDLEAVRKHFGFQKVILLGHSWGGLLATEYAIKYPQHVSSLILLNSVPLTSKGYQQFAKEYERRIVSIQQLLTQQQASPALQQADPEATAAFYRLLFSVYCAKARDAEKITLHFTKASAANAPKIEEIFNTTFLTKPYDLRPALRTLKVPALLIHGAEDPVPPATAEETHEALPSSILIILKNCGHFSFVEQLQRCFEEIRKFL
ncbi:MAG: alpha/beta fold hydrolase [Chthoniobacterales bacterium]|nr:alpha/beta fold hydrolase [Chthoniobacterales bacterium]